MAEAQGKSRRPRPTVSALLDSGEVVEMILRPEEKETAFVVYDGEARTEEEITLSSGEILVPYSPDNNLLTHEVVLLPSEAADSASEGKLVEEVRDFIHRYVDISELFEEIATHYVLFTWIYDDFNEVPYLRVRGDYGSGKSRFLLTLGSLCYKPIFASGASTVSPIFRILDAFRGILVIDEGDFRISDEKAEIVKILNNGNARGFPVLRSESTPAREFNPRAFHVFGPKVVATRGHFQDPALESRCITEEMGDRRLRSDIPLNLPHAFREEARTLRNKLLMFRLRNRGKERNLEEVADRRIEPRVSQIFAPLLATIDDGTVREKLHTLARRYSEELVSERSLAVEAQVLEVIKDLREAGQDLQVKVITASFQERFGDEYDRKITPRWVGSLLRRKLSLSPTKRNGTFVLPMTDYPKLDSLFSRYGLTAPGVDIGDVRDI